MCVARSARCVIPAPPEWVTATVILDHCWSRPFPFRSKAPTACDALPCNRRVAPTSGPAQPKKAVSDPSMRCQGFLSQFFLAKPRIPWRIKSFCASPVSSYMVFESQG